ncbi:MAG: FHA domain-containing protein [Kofleriaceae bacterium]
MRLSVALALLVTSSLASAQPVEDTKPTYHAVADRVDFERASIGGFRLRVYVSALSLQGQLLDVSDPKAIKLMLGTSEKKWPFTLGTYAATDGETDIVFVVQASSDFTDSLPQIADSLEHVLLEHLKDNIKVGIVMFGDAATAPKLVAAKAMRGKVALASDGSAGDPVLLDAIDRALIALKKQKPEVEGRAQRKMIVVIGDGRDSAGDHDRVTKTGARAAKEGVRIHTLAYSPADLRRPLLVLGELAKRSFGTFRWPGQGHKPGADTWNDAFRQLTDEITKQNVITYYPGDADDVAGKKLRIVLSGRTEASSNELRVPEAASCSGNPCETGYCADDRCIAGGGASGGGSHLLRWLAIIGGGIVGLVLLLAFIGWLITKRQERASQAPPPFYPPPGAPPGSYPPGPYPRGPASQPPGLLANGRPIPGLLVMSGPRTGERMTLRNGFLVGGQPASDLQIQDGYTSSNHAQFMMDAEGHCTLLDLGSTNGTFINGMQIQQQALQHGMTIKIGSTELRFLTE